VHVEFLDLDLRAVAYGVRFPGPLSVRVARALQAAVWSIEAAVQIGDIQVYGHWKVAVGEGEESILSLTDETGLSYRVDADTVTVTGVLAQVRSA